MNKAAAATAYGITSILLVMINKKILFTYKFGSPIVLLLMHLSFSLFFLEASRHLNLLLLREWETRIAMKMLPLSLTFVLNILCSFYALRFTSVPIFTTLRRMTTMFVLLTQWKVLGMTPTRTVVYCVILMMLGAILAGLGDLGFDPLGYMFVFLNNTLTAGYLVAMKYYFGSLKLQAVEVLRYNCMLSIPLIFMLTIANGQLFAVLNSLQAMSFDFLSIFLTSGFLAFAVNFSTYWCTHVNNPLTTSVTGQLKNILTTVLGMMLFPDVHINSMFLCGIGIGTVGGVLYSVHKFMESQQTKETNDKDAHTQDAPGNVEMGGIKKEHGGMGSPRQ